MLNEFLITINFMSMIVLVTYAVRQYIFVFAALWSKKVGDPLGRPSFPTVSILIPAHNEEKVLGRTLEHICKLDYPHDKLEVLVLDDNSTDSTCDIAQEWANKCRLIQVIHRPIGGLGKGVVLNQGIRQAKNQIVIVFDADYTPQPDTIKKLTRWFEDPKVGLVQGRIHVINKDENMLTKMIHTERCAGFLCDLFARDKLKVTNQFGGTAGGFRRELISEVGEWKPKTYCEDTDLTCRALLAGYKVKYDVTINCGEEAPDKLKVYYKQRYRWIRGHIICALKYTSKFLASPFLSLREKVEGVLWLNLNCLPFFILLGTAAAIINLMSERIDLLPQPFSYLWMLFGLGATIGTVLTGLYKVKQVRYLRFVISMLLNSYVMCFIVSMKAYLDILTNRPFRWIKTERSGLVT